VPLMFTVILLFTWGAINVYSYFVIYMVKCYRMWKTTKILHNTL